MIRRLPNAQLVLAGEGRELDALQNQARTLRLAIGARTVR